MNLYQYQLLFAVRSAESDSLIQLDRQTHILNAIDEDEALRKALKHGLEEQGPIYTMQSGKLIWEFEALSFLRKLDKEDGRYFVQSETIDKSDAVAVLHGAKLCHEALIYQKNVVLEQG
ncbi:MAG: hypothetical protein EP332_06185 [Bacteroidetes bacterium]|nr:MAG: hypothetical protein EP332_06185 [Bacteroidota bacterium]